MVSFINYLSSVVCDLFHLHLLVCADFCVFLPKCFLRRLAGMLTGFMDGLLCCLSSKSANVVVPAESSECVDGFEFVEVKPGRVLRVRHIIPDRPVVDEPTGQGGSFSSKRKITVYRNGQLYIENFGDRVRAAPKNCQNGGTELNSTVEVELTDCGNSVPSVSIPEAQSDSITAGKDGASLLEAGREAPAAGQTDPSQQPRKRRRKPKRTVVIDCERKISACKGTHADVALFFIHGVGGSLDIWTHQLDFFSKQGYEVIAADLAGHGASSEPQIAAAYTFYALAEDMRLIFKRYARKRNILIGHSYG